MVKVLSAAILISSLLACDFKPPVSKATPPSPSAVAEVAPPKVVPSPEVVAPKSTPTAVPAPSESPKVEPSPEPRPEMYPARQDFAVKPVEGEPVWPDPSEEAEIKRRGYSKIPGGYEYELRDAAGKVTSSGVVFSGMVLMDRGLIEVFACGEGGKEHESIFRVDCDIQCLDLSLVLCGLERGPVPAKLNDPTQKQGSRVVALLQWADENGKIVTHRAEDAVLSLKRMGPMPRVGWTYVANMIEMEDPTSSRKKSFHILAATTSRSIITTFRDVSTVLDNPLEEGTDDTLFAANYMVLPSGGTKIRVILRAPTAVEKESIAQVEKEISK
jgi:hypothetical protein